MGKLEIFCAGVSIDVLPCKPLRNILVNVPDQGITSKTIINTVKMFQYTHCIHTYLDSGGYQIFCAERDGKDFTFDVTQPLLISNKGINITPRHVIDVAVDMQPEIVSALDFPIKTLTDKIEQEKEFMGKLGYNITWSRETARLRKEKCPNVKLLIPVQCYTVEQFNEFFHYIKDLKFDGLSMPVRNFYAHEIAPFLITFYKLNIHMIHILGTSTLLTTALAAYMAKHYFAWVSMDATSWRLSAQHSNYVNPLSLKVADIGNNVIIDENIHINCPCPWCNGKTFTYIKNLPHTEKISFLRSHNFWVIENAAKDLYEHADTVLTLKEHLLTRFPDTVEIEKLCSVLTIIDALRDSEIEEILFACRLDYADMMS